MRVENYWTQPYKWDKAAHETGKPELVFCASMADVFEDHPAVIDARERLFKLIVDTPHLRWLLLTKRPQNIYAMVPRLWKMIQFAPRNVWFGITAENQEQLDRRWPVLENETHFLEPSVLFLSLEPLLGPIDLSIALKPTTVAEYDYQTQTVDWVIVGGEAAHRPRPMSLNWARHLQAQCRSAGVPFFFKQTGGRQGKGTHILDGEVIQEFPTF